MTPEMNTAKIAYNDAPDELKTAITLIYSLTKEERHELLKLMKEVHNNV